MQQLVIIGGGIHGSALAMRLAEQGFRDLVILDSTPPLARWLKTTPCLVGDMLRSPWDANIDPRDDIPEALRASTADLAGFNRHVVDLRDKYRLNSLWMRGTVKKIAPRFNSAGFVVETENQRLRAEQVVIACGLGNPHMPFDAKDDRIRHADSCNFDDIRKGSEVAIIGGSITGLTIATELARRGAVPTVLHRGEIHTSQLEVAPEWRPIPGAERFQYFLKQTAGKRSQLLHQCRQFGTVTNHVLDKAKSAGVTIKTNTPVLSWKKQRGKIVLFGSSDNKIGAFDYVLCATGYKGGISLVPCLSRIQPRIDLVDDLPVLTRQLESSVTGLYFLGRLAELGLGPLGRNIIGAKVGSKIISKAILDAQ